MEHRSSGPGQTLPRTRAGIRGASPTVLLAAFMLLVAMFGLACSNGGNHNGGGAVNSEPAASTPTASGSATADIVVPVGDAKLAQTVSDRFQSFNLEMASVVGGTFWAPRGDTSGQATTLHPPVELDERLANLTKRLSPTYIRVSGSWANKVYFDDSATPPSEAPDGFQSVLTGDRWAEVGRFASDAGNKMVTSFSVGAGTRAPDGSWTPDLAERFLRYTVDHDVPVEAAEFINEPNIQGTSGATYDAEGFARDVRVLKDLRNRVDPKLELLGPGGMVVNYEVPKPLDDPTTEDLLGTSAGLFDAFSFHAYTGMSSRCPTLPQVPVNRLMDRDVLAVLIGSIDQSKTLRDRYMPGKKIWLTETSTAACGGDETAPTFEGAFAYLEHLGDAARNGVWVHMYNTLVASDYGIIDDTTHMPRPSYWAAYLWKRLMGTRALDVAATGSAATSPEEKDSSKDKVSIYGHCQPNGKPGSVGVLISNRDGERSYTIDVGSNRAEVFALSAKSLGSGSVLLNGEPLVANEDGTFAEPRPAKADGRALTVEPYSLTFVSLPDAKAKACRSKV